jgi:hypothetical protein
MPDMSLLRAMDCTLQKVAQPVTGFSTRDLLWAYSMLSQMQLQWVWGLHRGPPSRPRETC